MRNNKAAAAEIYGSQLYPKLRGEVIFSQKANGVFVTAKISGLPIRGKEENPFFAFHIHEGGSCTGNKEDPFADTRLHYNPYDVPHPNHIGDMPPLISANGYAYLSFFTNRFTVAEIIGKTVVIHAMVDDFMSQPSGNSGMKIACGIIKKL